MITLITLFCFPHAKCQCNRTIGCWVIAKIPIFNMAPSAILNFKIFICGHVAVVSFLICYCLPKSKSDYFFLPRYDNIFLSFFLYYSGCHTLPSHLYSIFHNYIRIKRVDKPQLNRGIKHVKRHTVKPKSLIKEQESSSGVKFCWIISFRQNATWTCKRLQFNAYKKYKASLATCTHQWRKIARIKAASHRARNDTFSKPFT